VIECMVFVCNKDANRGVQADACKRVSACSRG